MAELRIIQDSGKDIFPVTHEDAVLDKNGKAISRKYITADEYDESTDITIDFYDSELVARVNTLESDVEVLKNTVSEELREELRNELDTLDSEISDTSEQLSLTQSKVADLESDLQEVFQRGNEVKEMFVDTLIAKGFDLSTNNTFEDINTTITTSLTKSIELPVWISNTESWLSAKPSPNTLYFASGHFYKNKIYLFGGYRSDVAHSEAWCYDILNNTWSAKSNMVRACYRHHSAIIDDKVYILGGYSASKDNTCYDITNDSYTTKTSLPAARNSFAISVYDKTIYVMSGLPGDNSTVPVDTNYAYDSVLNTWSTKTVTPFKVYHTVAVNLNNKIHVLGGYDNNKVIYSSHHCYDPVLDSWTTLTDMPFACYRHQATVLKGKIHVMGGYDSLSAITDAHYSYDAITNSWSTRINAPYTLANHTMIGTDDYFYSMGGASSSSANYYYINTFE